MKKSVLTDPVAAALILCCFVFALVFLVVFAAFVVIPVAVLTVAGILAYRWYILEKIKSPENIPDTIKERPDYLEPSALLQSIENDRWLLNRGEEETGKYSCQALADAFHFMVAQLYAQESFHEPPIKPETTDRITLMRYYDRLQAWQRKVSDENNFELFMHLLVNSYLEMRKHFPPYALQASPEPIDSCLSTPLQIRDEPEVVSKLLGGFFDADFRRRGLFADLRAQIEENAESEPEPTLASYFAHTPFRAFSKVNIPITLFDETRFAGMWVCAPQGTGKTTLLHALVKDDLAKNAAIILMDSKGDLNEPFLDHPALAARRVIIGPDHPIGMNPLDIHKADINKAVDNLEYLFSSLLDFKLTGTQSMVLKSVLRALVIAFDQPNLQTFHELMSPNGEKKYAAQIARLDTDLQNFFIHEYNGVNIRERRNEVLQRLRTLLDNDVLRSMLMAPKTTFRIGEAMDQGAVVIINNSRGRLGNKGAEFLGRFFIAQVLAAAQERSFKRESEKKPVYFYIDEAHTVVAQDERITDVYHECRSHKIALCCAHQETSQISEKVLAAFQNCAIRFAHPDDEIRRMALSLRIEPKRLQGLRKGQFGAYVRGLVKEGLVVNVQKADLSVLNPSRQPYRARLPAAPPPALQPPEPEAPVGAAPPPAQGAKIVQEQGVKTERPVGSSGQTPDRGKPLW
jgi:hypothetical protein